MSSKSRRPFALLVVLCVAAVVGVLTGVTRPLLAAPFANTGHWVYNSVLGTVFHVDGATTNLDAQMVMDAEVGSQVLQSDTSGFVVGRSRITEFDKESMSPRRSTTPPADETPLGIEVVGGPYAVYRNAGKVVRLGDPAATISAGGPIGDPVVTSDGTMWLHRNGNGQICRLDKGAVTLSGCPVSAPKDHAGALTIVDGRPAFVDLFASTLHTIDGSTFGAGVPLGVSLSPNARPAPQDTDGRIAIFDPARSSLVLVDTRNRAEPVTVALPSGDYDGPVSTGDVVALVDRKKGTVLTFGANGERKDEKPIKQKTGEPRLSQGEDKRIYVEDADGTQVLVVSEDGSVRDVDVTGKPKEEAPTGKPDETGDTGQPSGPPTPGPSTGGGSRPGPQPGPRPGTDTPAPPPPPVPPSRPGAPPSVAAQPGNGSAVVTWGTAPDNRAPITAYQVTWPGGSITAGPGDRQVTIPNLTNGVAYVFTVAATNQVGTGPGASANAVTPVSPVSPAAAPVNLNGTFDVDDRPTRDVTLTWQQPALNGGTLVHYEVTANGAQHDPVTGTQVVYPQVNAADVITFTVRAVTRSPDGQTLVGEPASWTHRDTQQVVNPSVSISRGGPSETDNCHAPNCSWVIATMSGLAPNTTYDIKLSADDTDNVRTESFTSDANGAATYDQLNYDAPGNNVWVSVRTSSGWAASNKIAWE